MYTDLGVPALNRSRALAVRIRAAHTDLGVRALNRKQSEQRALGESNVQYSYMYNIYAYA